MTTFDQELTGRYVAAGGDRSDLDTRRVARAVFVRDTNRTLCGADKKLEIDLADTGSLAELVDAAEERLDHIANDVNQRSVMCPAHRRRHRMGKYHSVLGGVALAVALTFTGCGGDDTEPKVQVTPSQSPSPTPTNTPAPKTPEEEAAAQLTKYLDMRDTAYRKRTIDFKTLNPVATGEEFLELQEAVVDMKQADVTKTGSYVHTLGEPRDRGISIEVTDCEDRTGVTVKVKGNVRKPDYTAPDGNPLRNPVPVKYTLVKDKGTWKVTESDLLWDQSC